MDLTFLTRTFLVVQATCNSIFFELCSNQMSCSNQSYSYFRFTYQKQIVSVLLKSSSPKNVSAYNVSGTVPNSVITEHI